MHPLVRNLYKQAIHVGREYPLGLDKVRREWKKAIRNPKNCPSCYDTVRSTIDDEKNRVRCSASSKITEVTIHVPKMMHSKDYPNPNCERELRKAVGKGRHMIREMIGVIQLKKYRSMKRRYGERDHHNDNLAMFNKNLTKP